MRYIPPFVQERAPHTAVHHLAKEIRDRTLLTSASRPAANETREGTVIFSMNVCIMSNTHHLRRYKRLGQQTHIQPVSAGWDGMFEVLV